MTTYATTALGPFDLVTQTRRSGVFAHASFADFDLAIAALRQHRSASVKDVEGRDLVMTDAVGRVHLNSAVKSLVFAYQGGEIVDFEKAANDD